MAQRFLVFVIGIFVIRICFVLRVSDFGSITPRQYSSPSSGRFLRLSVLREQQRSLLSHMLFYQRMPDAILIFKHPRQQVGGFDRHLQADGFRQVAGFENSIPFLCADVAAQ